MYDGIVMWEDLESNYWEEDFDKLSALYDKLGLTEDTFREYCNAEEKSDIYREIYGALDYDENLEGDVFRTDDGIILVRGNRRYKICVTEENTAVKPKEKMDSLDESNYGFTAEE